MRVLDAGCGSGRDIYQFLLKGIGVADGFDPAVKFYELALSKINLLKYSHQSEIYLADYNSFVADKTYHGIFSLASLFHVPKINLLDAL